VTANLGHTSILRAFIVALAGIVSSIIAGRSGDQRYLSVPRYAILA